MTTSYLIYDFETDGRDPHTCRPLQVAWQRFDLGLKPIEDPVTLTIKPAPDRLPHPRAIEITGISLKQCADEGLSDAEAFRRLHAEVNRPGTCTFGWNTRRFDNTLLRFGFWRNFVPVYEHEWSQGCDAWDLIDLARACCALRPDGLTWPTHDDGAPTFRLDRLAPANGIDHGDAHDAMADVHATMEMARLIHGASPRLWKFARTLADTKKARSIACANQPFVHVTSRIRASQYCTAPFAMLADHPIQKHVIIAWNLRQDPTEALDADVDTLRHRIFTREDELPEGVCRFSVKQIKLNAAPFVAPMTVLNEANLTRLHLNLNDVHTYDTLLKQHGGELAKRLAKVHDDPFEKRTDPDDSLYGGGFPSSGDEILSRNVPTTPPTELHLLEQRFTDPRLGGLLRHYIARNHPDVLSDVQREQWIERTANRLKHPVSKEDLSWSDWCTEVDQAIANAQGPTLNVLRELRLHGLAIGANVGLTPDSA
jgi:exodeoxyribonuclease-1